MRRHGKLVSVVFSAILAGCSAARLPRPNPVQRQPPHISYLSARWEEGSCSISDSQLTFHDFSDMSKAFLNLDSPADDPQELICTAEHTVILNDRRIIVALGADDVLSGREMLGFLDGEFVPANSYSITVRGMGRITGGLVMGDRLHIRTADSRLWSIDLANPRQGWDVF